MNFLTDVSQSFFKLFNDNDLKLIELYNINDENVIYLMTFAVAFICIFVVYMLAIFFHDDKQAGVETE